MAKHYYNFAAYTTNHPFQKDHKIQRVERIDDILICCSAGQCPVSEAIIHTPGNVTCETSIQYTCVTPRDVFTWTSSAFDLDVAVAAGATIPQLRSTISGVKLIEQNNDNSLKSR